LQPEKEAKSSQNRAGVKAQMVEYPPGNHKIESSNPSTDKKKKRQTEERGVVKI
jgi:hypothetical protein